MTVDVSWAKEWLAITLSLFALFGVIKAALNGLSKQNSEDIAVIKEQNKQFETRLKTVELELAHLPSKEMFMALQIDIAKIDGNLDGMKSLLKANNAMCERIQEALTQRALEK